MKVIDIETSKLIPYENNPRLNEDAVPYVAESIRTYGFKVPIVIDKHNVIVTGHTRWKAAQSLHMKTVPCIIADDLTDDQIRAFRLVDNKVSEYATWDFAKLEIELDNIDMDLSSFDFDVSLRTPTVGGDGQSGETTTTGIDDGYFGDERERTYDSVNLNDYDPSRVAGKYNMPMLRVENHIPQDMISFNYVLNTEQFDKGVHFCIDDYQFERIWNRPYEYMDRLSKFDCVATPDWSLYLDMPLAMQIWNVYRSRLIGQIMQDMGMKVLPTLSWSDKRSYEFCFDGIPKGGTVFTSTVGVMRDENAQQYWIDGMTEAMKRVKPKHVVVYGKPIDFNWGDTTVQYIENHNTERFVAR